MKTNGVIAKILIHVYYFFLNAVPHISTRIGYRCRTRTKARYFIHYHGHFHSRGPLFKILFLLPEYFNFYCSHSFSLLVI
jgi:hypothetical protein